MNQITDLRRSINQNINLGNYGPVGFIEKRIFNNDHRLTKMHTIMFN